MADRFTLQGSYTATPATGSPSAVPQITAPINESMTVGASMASQITLTADGVTALPFGPLTAANVLIIKCIGGKVTVRVSTAGATDQEFPVDSFLALTSLSEDITAISVERNPATETVVTYFLGQRA